MADAADAGTGGGRRWQFYTLGVIVCVGSAVTGVLIAATHPPEHGHRHGPVFTIVFAAVLAVVASAMVVWSLHRQLNRPAMRHLRSFSFSQRRAVIRAVNSGRALTGEQQRIAQAQFEQLTSASTRMRRMWWALPVAVISFAVLAIADSGGLRWLWATIAVIETLSTSSTLLLFRRQRQRLENALD